MGTVSTNQFLTTNPICSNMSRNSSTERCKMVLLCHLSGLTFTQIPPFQTTLRIARICS